jgi:hypothetical protein
MNEMNELAFGTYEKNENELNEHINIKNGK